MKKKEETLDDPLGIADQPVTRTPDDIHAGNSPEEVKQRRARALGESDGEVARTPGDENHDGFGSTSVDMGYGGEGNAVKKEQQ